MTRVFVPDYIVAFHRALLAALRVDFFPPGLLEMNAWRDFLSVMSPLEETPGGAFHARDIAAAVTLMRAQNKSGASNWALRFSKIMQTPEAFRDLVLIARKGKRERAPLETKTVQTADGANVAVEHDPAAENETRPICESVEAQMRKFREEMRKPAAERNL